MSETFNMILLESSVAKICKRAGFRYIASSAHNVLSDMASARLIKIISSASKYAMSSNDTHLSVEHVREALGDLGLEADELVGRGAVGGGPLSPQVRTTHVDPTSGRIRPGLPDVHQWLKECGARAVRRSQRLIDRQIRNTVGELEPGSASDIFQKRTRRARKLASCAHCRQAYSRSYPKGKASS